MLKEERQQTILNEVDLHNRILITDIAEALDVSIDTIRRDVKELDADNKLRKVHGGAISMGYMTNSARNTNIYKIEEKAAIAAKAISMLRVGAVIFIGTGYVDAIYGLTEFDWDIVQIKKAVIKASKKTVLLSISEKLNSQHRYKTCDINSINTMITELKPEDKLLKPFKNHDIKII